VVMPLVSSPATASQPPVFMLVDRIRRVSRRQAMGFADLSPGDRLSVYEQAYRTLTADAEAVLPFAFRGGARL